MLKLTPRDRQKIVGLGWRRLSTYERAKAEGENVTEPDWEAGVDALEMRRRQREFKTYLQMAAVHDELFKQSKFKKAKALAWCVCCCGGCGGLLRIVEVYATWAIFLIKHQRQKTNTFNSMLIKQRKAQLRDKEYAASDEGEAAREEFDARAYVEERRQQRISARQVGAAAPKLGGGVGGGEVFTRELMALVRTDLDRARAGPGADLGC